MATEHHIRCGYSKQSQQHQQQGSLDLHIGRGSQDVHLDLEQFTSQMCKGLTPILADTLEIASYVYAADQALGRGGSLRIDYGNAWDRHFLFDIPVRCLKQWQSPEILTQLENTLNFLSNDHYTFRFRSFRNPPQTQGHIVFATTEQPTECEEVVLFSGGADSLAGAVQEILVGQRRVALVSHRPVNTLYHRQRNLVEELTERVQDRTIRPLHVPICINNSRARVKEFTQRTRSFLFACCGMVIAQLYGLPRLRFYENGITSLNIPITTQLVGGRASRTTHPKVLQDIAHLFSLLLNDSFEVKNPFQFSTKTDVLT